MIELRAIAKEINDSAQLKESLQLKPVAEFPKNPPNGTLVIWNGPMFTIGSGTSGGVYLYLKGKWREVGGTKAYDPNATPAPAPAPATTT